MHAAEPPHPDGANRWAGALVSDPIGTSALPGWQIGSDQPPCVPDPTASRSARLEARLTVYARYAAIVAEGAAALVAGDEARQTELVAARDDVAEHLAELHGAAPIVDPSIAFGDVLTDACHELRFQDGIDRALRRTLGTLYETVAPHHTLLAATAEERPAPQLDLRF